VIDEQLDARVERGRQWLDVVRRLDAGALAVGEAVESMTIEAWT
jgi:hypothetical protein